MNIYKIYNNNVVSVIEDEKEVIVMGKGIAFKKKIGDKLDESLIDKSFYLKDEDMNSKFKQLLADIPTEHIALAGQIVEYASRTLDKKLGDSLYISLSDHIYTSIQRFLDGITIRNPMLWEIQRFYEPEYEIGLKALEMIEDVFKIRLLEDEAGFIAMHIVEAEMDNNAFTGRVYEITKIVHCICNIVKYYFNIHFDTKSVYYFRFITHIRFFAQRLLLGQVYDNHNEDELFQIIKEKYKNAYQCVLKIEGYTKKNYGYSVNNDEKLYLMIHIECIVNKASK